jgi:hypothetical protein
MMELIATYVRALHIPKPLCLRHSSYVSASIHVIDPVEEITIEGMRVLMLGISKTGTYCMRCLFCI